MIDIHSHVLPAIDDGAKSLEDSVELCRLAVEDGTRTLVATPHIRDGVWNNERGRIATRVDELRAELVKRAIDLDVVLGAEIFFAFGILDAVREGAFPTYADGRRYLLLELPTYFIPRQVQDVVFELRTSGITPIIAHPERNAQLMSSLDLMDELVRMGALGQLTAMSVSGRFGRGARRAADTLLERGLVHFVASDGHDARFRPTRMRSAYERIAASHGDALARELFVENPRRVVAGEEVEGGVRVPDAPAARGLRGLLSRVLG